MARYATIHNRPQKPKYNVRRYYGTYVVEVPEFSDLIDFSAKAVGGTEGSGVFPIEIGAAFLHPDDQLNKKIGREIAMSRRAFLGFTLYQVELAQNYVTFCLTADDTFTNTIFDIQLRAYYDGRFVRVMRLSSFEKGDTK